MFLLWLKKSKPLRFLEQLTSKENMNKSTYVLDMKMTREKQRNSLT